jgi:large subunit ribosomal protein L29
MPIGSKDLIVDNLDKIEDSLLVEELKKAKEELFNLRFQSATGQLESHGRLRAVKRDIARIYTIIRERELGIRAVPAAAAVVPTKAKKSDKPAESEAVSSEASSKEAPSKEAKTKTKESK